MARVFILGAGASRAETEHRDIPMPLANDFFGKTYLEKYWRRWRTSSSRDFRGSELYGVLSQYFSFSRKGNINVEEVLSFLESWKHTRPSVETEQYIENARRDLLTYVYETTFFVPWPYKKHRSSFYSRLARCMAVGDSIITFNWDLLIDNELKRTPVGRALLDRQAELLVPDGASSDLSRAAERRWSGAFIKLHGSVGWAVCRDVSCQRNGLPQRISLEGFEPHELTVFSFCDYCAGPMEFAILPPHFQKSLASNGFFRRQARLAAEVLDVAQEIVVVGYSFPQFDLESTSLLRSIRLLPWESPRMLRAHLSRVTIVDPAVQRSEFRARVGDVLGFGRVRSYGSPIQVNWYKSVPEYLAAEFPTPRKNRKRAPALRTRRRRSA